MRFPFYDANRDKHRTTFVQHPLSKEDDAVDVSTCVAKRKTYYRDAKYGSSILENFSGAVVFLNFHVYGQTLN